MKYIKELKQDNADYIQDILIWAYKRKLKSSSLPPGFTHDIFCKENNSIIDPYLFEFYMGHIKEIYPHVVLEEPRGTYYTTEWLKTYLLIEGGFLKTYKELTDKNSFDDKIKQLMHDELETSIINSSKANNNARKANIIAIISAVIAAFSAILTLILKK